MWLMAPCASVQYPTRVLARRTSDGACVFPITAGLCLANDVCRRQRDDDAWLEMKRSAIHRGCALTRRRPHEPQVDGGGGKDLRNAIVSVLDRSGEIWMWDLFFLMPF